MIILLNILQLLVSRAQTLNDLLGAGVVLRVFRQCVSDMIVLSGAILLLKMMISTSFAASLDGHLGREVDRAGDFREGRLDLVSDGFEADAHMGRAIMVADDRGFLPLVRALLALIESRRGRRLLLQVELVERALHILY